jgi:hypothetical protein
MKITDSIGKVFDRYKKGTPFQAFDDLAYFPNPSGAEIIHSNDRRRGPRLRN